MAGDCSGHCVGEGLPAMRGALDVREEERDGAGGWWPHGGQDSRGGWGALPTGSGFRRRVGWRYAVNGGGGVRDRLASLGRECADLCVNGKRPPADRVGAMLMYLRSHGRREAARRHTEMASKKHGIEEVKAERAEHGTRAGGAVTRQVDGRFLRQGWDHRRAVQRDDGADARGGADRGALLRGLRAGRPQQRQQPGDCTGPTGSRP